MSTTIDERVVSMQFDNRHFENNVKTSLSTLDKLKRSLRLEDASKGLENVTTAAKNVNMSGLSSAVENVKLKFSAMEVMAVTALANITNQAVNAGKRIAAAFTIDPIKSGFQEYETQINAVQTILANTESKGTTLDDVNQALDTLNTYADKTIYNFTEMTRNIGTFTAAGVDLETSVNAIQGIANLAAVSGSNAQQASTAMYQLSQALAAGTVKLQDWNSVVNAGMGGEVFQNALKETARVHGINIDKMIKKEGSFRETLSKGWLTSEILTETLQKFTLTTEGLTDAQVEANRQMLKSKGYTDEQIESIFKLGETATNAATKVKTFTQLMDTLKEAAQSGWTQTWELIIGDFDQAKNLWTSVSDTFGEMINKSAESRNTLLEGALTSNWDKLIKKVNEAGIETSEFEEKVKKAAKSHNIDIDAMIEKYGSLEKAFRSGAVSSDILKEALKGTGKAAKDSAKEAVTYTVKSGDTLTKIAKKYNTTVDELVKLNGIKDKNFILTGQVLKISEALDDTAASSDKTIESVDDLVDSITELGGREMLLESFKNIFEGILSVIKPIKSAFRNIFPPITSEQLYNVIKGFRDLTAKFKLNQTQANRLRRTFKGLFAGLDVIKTVVTGALGAGFKVLSKVLAVVGDKVLIVTARIGDVIWRFRNWLLEDNRLVNGFKATIEILKKVGTVVADLVKEFLKLPKVQNAINKVKESFKNVFSNVKDYFSEGILRIKDFIKRVMTMDSISLDDIGRIFKDFKENVIDYFFNIDIGAIFDKFKNALKNFKKNVTTYLANVDVASILESIKNAFKGFKDKVVEHLSKINLGSIFEKFKNALKNFKDGAVKYLDTAGVKFDSIKEKLLTFANFVRSILPGAIAIGMGILLIKGISGLGKVLETLAHPLEGITDILDNIGNSFVKLNKAKAFEAKTAGIKNIAVAIGILAASLTVLTLLDQKKLWSAVGALTVMTAAMVGLSILANKLGGVGDFGKTPLTMLAISGALFILVQSLKSMEDLDGSTLLRNIGVLAVLAVGLATIVGVLSKFAPKLSTGSLTFISIAAGIYLMVQSLEKIDKLQFNNLGQSLLVLAGIIVYLSVLSASISKTSFGSFVGIIAMAIGLKMMVGTLEDIASVNVDNIKNNIESFIAVFGALALLMLSTRLAGKNAASAGIGMLAMTASLLIAVKAIKKLSELDQSTIKRASDTLAKILLVFAGVVAISSFCGKNALGAGLTMLAFSASLLILIGAIAILKNLNPDGMDRALEAIGKIVLMFSMLMVASKFATSAMGTIIVLTVAISALAVAIAGLSFIDPEGLNNATKSLAIIIGMFAMLMVASKFATGSMGTLIVMTGAMVILAGIIYILNGLPIESTLVIAASLSVLILSLSASCLMLSMIPISGALTGIASFAIILAGIAAIMAVIAGLNMLLPDMNTFLAESLPTIELIGSAIGTFFGGIVAGFGEAATSTLPQIGTSLSTFMTNLQPFIDGAKSIDASSMEGVKAVIGIITSLTGANLLEGITSWITGESSMTKFATELPLFGQGLKTFSDNVTGINTEAITAAATAAQSLSAMASTIPNEGGLLALFTGDNKISDFGTQLPLFGEGIKGFADKVAGINVEAVNTAVSAATNLSTMANSLPESGGFWSIFTADNDMSTFASELKKFGEGIKDFSDSVSGIDIAAVNTSVSAARRLANIASGIPEGGYSCLKDFGDSIKSFGTKLKKCWDDGLSSIDSEQMSSAITAIKSLSSAVKEMSGTDYEAFSKFVNSLGDIGSDAVEKFIGAFTKSTGKVKTVGKEMVKALIEGVESMKSKISSAFKNTASDAVDGVRDKYNNFVSAGKYVVSGFAEGIESNTYIAEAKAKLMASAALKAAEEALGINSPSKEFYKDGKYSGMGFVNGLRDYMSVSYDAGSQMALSAKKGLSNSISKISNLIENGIDAQPTIRPVMDLSGVSGGVRTMNGMLGGINPSIKTLSAIGSIGYSMSRNQNGANSDVVTAIERLSRNLGNTPTNNYTVNGITYDDGSNVSKAIETLVRATITERRR